MAPPRKHSRHHSTGLGTELVAELGTAPGQRGFTLLEVLIAITLTTLVSISVANLVNQLVSAQERFATPLPLSADLDFSQLLEYRLTALVVRPVRERGLLQFNEALDYRPDLHRLEWVSLGDVALPIGDFYTRLRRQRLEWSSQHSQLTLSSTGLLDAAGTPSWQRVAVLEDVSALRLAFHDGERWRDAPPPNGGSRAVRLSWQRHERAITLMAQLPDPHPWP